MAPVPWPAADFNALMVNRPQPAASKARWLVEGIKCCGEVVRFSDAKVD